MPIHIHLLGNHLKVQSHNAVPPEQRAQPSPPALVLLCHGLYEPGVTPMVPVPAGIQVRFAVDHDQPNRQSDAKFYRQLLSEGVQSALEWDFKHLPVNGQVPDYALGKAAPRRERGDTPAAMMAMPKDERPEAPDVLDLAFLGRIELVDAVYVDNVQRYAESLKHTDAFDFASVRTATRCLSDVFDTITQTRPRYDYLLCAFCREPV